MFKYKIALVICDVMFWLYCKLYKYGKSKGLEDFAAYCIDRREDILESIATLKGIA